MATLDDKVKLITSRLNLLVPNLDTGPASTIRPIIDAVAEMSSQADSADRRSDESFVSLFGKTGKDLDAVARNFGFTRTPATYATGFITVKFSGGVSRDYLIEAGTRVYAKKSTGRTVEYEVATRTAVPRYSSAVPIPIIASVAGATSNANAGEIRNIDYDMDSVIYVVNETPVTGGAPEENDDSFRSRLRSNLFRNIASTEDYYTSIVRRHSSVSEVQLIKPMQVAEEHLKIVGGEAQSQEDSLVYTFVSEFGVYNVRSGEWLEEKRDFEVVVDNVTPNPPLFRFIQGGYWREGDDVLVRFGYCSEKSRNDPKSNTIHYLDIYVEGQSPFPVTDYSFWLTSSTYGNGPVTQDSHPGGVAGSRYYIFARQPVVALYPEMIINGTLFRLNRDYFLIKDQSPNGNSTRARDIIMWTGRLPQQRPEERGTPAEPGFHIPYYHDSVISEIQEVLDDPVVKGATDDILVHAAQNLVLNVNLTIEWERGIRREENLRDIIQNHLATVPMGTKIRMGQLLRVISNSNGVASVTLKDIKIPYRIRGRDSFRSDIPLLDGTVPILGELNIETTAPNVY